MAKKKQIAKKATSGAKKGRVVSARSRKKFEVLMAPKKKQIAKKATPPAKKGRVVSARSRKKNDEEENPLPEIIQPYSLIYPKTWSSGVNSISNWDVIDFVKRNVPPTVLERLNQTIFGNFFKRPRMKVQRAFIHSIVTREIYQPHNDCMCILVAGHPLYFGIEYFCLISGLRPGPEGDFRLEDSGYSEEFRKKYFPNCHNLIKRADVKYLLDKGERNNENSDEEEEKDDNEGNEVKGEKIPIESDDDYFRLALVYFITYFIMGRDPGSKIPFSYFDCVCDGTYDKAPWGLLSFNDTVDSLKKNGKKRIRPSSYKLKGCPLVFQTWFYEVVGDCEGFVCSRVKDDDGEFKPRFFKWRPHTNDFKAKDFNSMIFNKQAKYLKITKIVATEDEISKLSLQNYLPFAEPPEFEEFFGQGNRSLVDTGNHTEFTIQLEALSDKIDQGFERFENRLGVAEKKIETLSGRVTEIEEVLVQNKLRKKTPQPPARKRLTRSSGELTEPPLGAPVQKKTKASDSTNEGESQPVAPETLTAEAEEALVALGDFGKDLTEREGIETIGEKIEPAKEADGLDEQLESSEQLLDNPGVPVTELDDSQEPKMEIESESKKEEGGSPGQLG